MPGRIRDLATAKLSRPGACHLRPGTGFGAPQPRLIGDPSEAPRRTDTLPAVHDRRDIDITAADIAGLRAEETRLPVEVTP
ncbi:hypothetical protein [Roseicella aquatilis]|uniref:Uncharacterized protein n=1 Tax=Roseicella aquatilis TaxID=2527868 RepID=A0A4R4DQ97_9PROT|nr:hypothetical protein [Roseicella aquatilis]TCZ63253.1 hypothetical protein EXY23_10505 [Roseicella aquatilis]